MVQILQHLCSMNILVVDDNELILYSLTRMISHYRADVAVASNAYDAIIKINSNHYDICFLELQLPDASGLEVIKMIKESSPDTRTIIMTSPPINDDSKKLIEKWEYQVITKPFDLAEIKNVLNSAVVQG